MTPANVKLTDTDYVLLSEKDVENEINSETII